MKSFIAALVVFALLIGGILAVNGFAAHKIDSYLSTLPKEDEELSEALPRLSDIKEDVNRRLWLLNGCIHHEKTEDLLVSLSSAIAAAEADDGVEYALQIASLRQRLLVLKTEFTLTVKDFL